MKFRQLILGIITSLFVVSAGAGNIIKMTGPRCIDCSGTPEGEILFQMDMSSGAAENAGWVTQIPDENLPSTSVRQATGSLSGGPGYLITQGTGAGDNYWGWSDRATYWDVYPPVAGTERYYRLKFHFPSGQTFGGTTMVNKILIIHDSDNGDQQRALLQVEASSSSITFSFQHDGGANQLATTPTSTQTDFRYSVQWFVKYSSGHDLADGQWKVWINNNNEGSPTIQDTAMVQNLPTGSNNNLMRMGYMNTALAGGQSHSWFIEEYEVGTTFDSSWSP